MGRTIRDRFGVRDGTAFGLVLVGAAVAAVVVGLLGSMQSITRSGDARRYLDMATVPSVLQEAPWGFRIGVPFAANVLPVEPELAIAILNLVALVVATVLLAMFVGREHDTRRAVLAVGLLLASGPVQGLLPEGLVDMPALAVMLACLVAAQRGRWFAVLPLVVVGVTIKEGAAMVVLPLAIMASTLPDDRRRKAGAWVAAAGVAGMLTFAAIRWTPLVFGQRHGAAALLGPSEVLGYQRQHQGSALRSIANAAYTQFGVLVVPALFGLPRSRGWTRALVSLVVPITVTLLIATDWPRLLGYGVLVVIPLVCALGRPTRVEVVTLVAAVAAQIVWLPHLHGPIKPILLLASLLAALLFTLRVHRRAATSS